MKTIKDAVIELGGVWPSNNNGQYKTNWHDKTGDSLSFGFTPKICSRQEFESTAKRLGYINGYRWGVEYPTNGKRPDLPDDVFVELTFGCGSKMKCKTSSTTFESRSMHDPIVVSFQINDTRYLQSVSEISESKSDEAVVSEKPEYKQKQPDVSDLIIALSDASNLAVDLGMTDCAREILDVCKSAQKDRKRESTVDAAMRLSADYYDAHTLFYAMYDAGMLVLPPETSNTK